MISYYIMKYERLIYIWVSIDIEVYIKLVRVLFEVGKQKF